MGDIELRDGARPDTDAKDLWRRGIRLQQHLPQILVDLQPVRQSAHFTLVHDCCRVCKPNTPHAHGCTPGSQHTDFTRAEQRALSCKAKLRAQCIGKNVHRGPVKYPRLCPAHLGNNCLLRLIGDPTVHGSADVVEQQLVARGGAAREQGAAVQRAQSRDALAARVQLTKPCTKPQGRSLALCKVGVLPLQLPLSTESSRHLSSWQQATQGISPANAHKQCYENLQLIMTEPVSVL